MTTSASRISTNGQVVDCHLHVFEASNLFPFKVKPYYEPPISPVSALLEAIDATGVSRFVLVQPTPYGDDLSLLEASLAKLSQSAKGVGVAGPSTDITGLARLQDAGVTALRFVETRRADGTAISGTVSLDALCDSLAPKLNELGMHAELWAPLSETLSRWGQLEKAGIPIVLDHMGGFDPRAGRNHKDFQRLLGLLREGAVWVKLAICRRAIGGDFEAIRPFHDDIVEAGCDHLVWASDFPFVQYPGKLPSIEQLLDLFRLWVADETIAHKIMVENPARLYQFGQTAHRRPRALED
ncbi:2-pyrone-4,6-dicarboxylate lactonase [Mesorhizobium soli]|uniref:amidohydrolase family protein n=1 Tax=Pseudaminobacter soli (ex Li et al. 2025) TaxID=1295366 RepID=UPI00247396D0|nr:amidohydrolase family protein [Mesorhizobium soli]MDH6232213.1 2-pyrone-4,6-dicarboxylate lactonase [Mesorhizobium soli]